jgi:dihydrofolate synthase / folylpolyglutamate synthase
MFTRVGVSAYKKDLHNTIALLEALGNPHHKFKSIHIAGTNGKGSTSHMLAAIMHEAGYKTGLYTSPHLYDFRERIKSSGTTVLEMCPEEFIIDFTETLKPIIEKIEPSFFEVTVAMAFEWFARQQVDLAIIETGLGGRLDSTNVITPELSIITNIGWDHMNILGDTLGKIAYEKAGIIKPGIPVVIGESLPETQGVFMQKAGDCGAPLFWAEKEWHIESCQTGIDSIEIGLKKKSSGETVVIQCDLPGIYQQYNIRTVITALGCLHHAGWHLPEKGVLKGLGQVQKLTGLGGRWQVIGREPYIVLDVAHNEHGLQPILEQITKLANDKKIHHVHMVIGMVKDKDVDKVLSLLPADFRYYFTQAQMPRALPYPELLQKAESIGLKGEGFENVNMALVKAKERASPNDMIVVCGSIFVVAEVKL